MWMWTRSEWFTRPFFLKFDLAPCCSCKPNPSRNPGTACREEDKNLLTWHWWTNYQTTGKLRRIIIILAHRCWQHNSVISPREFQRKYDYGSSIVLSAINGIWFCVKQPLLCRLRQLLKAKHPSWIPLKFARLIIIRICCKDAPRHLLETGNRWKTKAGENRGRHTLMRTYFATLHLWVLSHFHYCGVLSFLRTVFKVFPNLTLLEAAVNLRWVCLPSVSSTHSMQQNILKDYSTSYWLWSRHTLILNKGDKLRSFNTRIGAGCPHQAS